MKKIAFIGAGNMAYAIASGAIASKTISPASIVLYDTNTNQYDKFNKDCSIALDLCSLIKQSDYIFLSVKPQNVNTVMSAIKNEDFTSKTIISICAGVTISSIQAVLGDVGIIRAMPNTPLLIGEGVTALCHNEIVDKENINFIDNIFSSSGITTWVNESDINTITATTGSSPAYVYLFIKSICDAAQKLGLDSADTIKIVCKTFIGASNMILSSDKSIDDLISMVKSPNGTTERALNVLEEHNINDIIYLAMKACAERADELSKLV